MKRFYREVTTFAAPGGHEVRLDGKPMRTPGRRPLLLPAAALAEAIAEEWRAQGEEIQPETMPLTRLATTVVDLMPARRGDAIAEVLGYAGSDLLCHRAPEPEALRARQEMLWQPWLDWAQRRLDVTLVPVTGVIMAEPNEAAERTLAAAVHRLDDWRLVGLHAAVTLTGSIVLGLAIEAGELAADTAFDAMLLDELFQIELWGLDELQRQRHARLRRDLEAARRYLALLG